MILGIVSFFANFGYEVSQGGYGLLIVGKLSVKRSAKVIGDHSVLRLVLEKVLNVLVHLGFFSSLITFIVGDSLLICFRILGGCFGLRFPWRGARLILCAPCCR
jgi:hypothetical protein